MLIMKASCEVTAPIHSTLLEFLLWGDRSASSFSVRFDGCRFMREYVERGTNALLWLALVFAITLLLRKTSALVRLWVLGSRIPGPPCVHLFCGLMRSVPDGIDFTEYLSTLHEKYGSIVKLWLDPTQLLVSVKDPVVISDVLVMANDKLPLTGSILRLVFGRCSLFVPSFDKVKARRESLSLHLYGACVDKASKISSKVVDTVFKRVDSAMDTGIFDCWSISQHLAFYIVGATVFGDDFFVWGNAVIYEDLLMKITKSTSFWGSYKFPPVWKKEFWTYQYLYLRFKYLTIDAIQHCRRNCNLVDRLDGSSDKSPKLLLDDMVAEGFFLDEVYLHLVSEKEPCGNIMGLMLHAFLRTAILLNNVITRLVLHPENQEEVYVEIFEACKKQSKSNSFDVQKMQLLMATICESARLSPTGSLLQRCSLKSDINIKANITVPAGAVVIVPVQLVQTDSSIWGYDACQFNPHRFLSKSLGCRSCNAEDRPGSVPKKSLTGLVEEENHEKCPVHLSEASTNVTFLPFGFGSRSCVGQKYVLHGISTLFAYLIQDYKIRLHPASENNPEFTTKGSVAQLLTGSNIVFLKRNAGDYIK